MRLLISIIAVVLFAPSLARAEIDADLLEEFTREKGKDYVEKLKKNDPERDPDKAPSGTSLLSGELSGVTDVMMHGGESTDPNSNRGAKHYAFDAISSDDQFFSKAYKFYRQLRREDAARDRIFLRGSPHVTIQETSDLDAFKLALTFANGNAYQALKLLAVYGHDDEVNTFETQKDGVGKERGLLLDRVVPITRSSLYVNGALGGTHYTKSQISEGMAIAKACNGPPFVFLSSALNFCNDSEKDYLGDYYHVINSAFTACRRLIQAKANKGVLPGFISNQKIVDELYLLQIRKYKIGAFRSKIKGALETLDHQTREKTSSLFGNVPDPKDPKGLRLVKVLGVMNTVLDRIEAGIKPALPPRTQTKPLLDGQEYSTAKAIAHRYEFEVNFRVEQHKLGMAFGRQVCKDMDSFDTIPKTVVPCP